MIRNGLFKDRVAQKDGSRQFVALPGFTIPDGLNIGIHADKHWIIAWHKLVIISHADEWKLKLSYKAIVY